MVNRSSKQVTARIKNKRLREALFHVSSIKSAYEIIKNDKFLMSSSIGLKVEREGENPPFFLSTMRSLDSSFFDTYKVRHNPVVFALSQKKLSSNKKIEPFSYWGERNTNAEEEERIFSYNETLKASTYIMEVHILINRFLDKAKALELVRILKAKKVPVIFHKDKKSLKALDKDTGVTFNSIKEQEGRKSEDTNPGYRFGAFRTYQLYAFLNIIKAKSKSEISNKALRQVKSSFDQIIWFLDNNKPIPTNLFNPNSLADEIKLLKKFPSKYAEWAQFLKKNKIKSSDEVIDFVVRKYFSLVEAPPY